MATRNYYVKKNYFIMKTFRCKKDKQTRAYFRETYLYFGNLQRVYTYLFETP